MSNASNIEILSHLSGKSKTTLPKVLIVGQPFNKETGGGITLSNLFEGWDHDRLAVVCSGYLINENTNTETCSNYYQLGQKEHKWALPFNLIKRKYYSGPISFNNKSTQIRKENPPSSLRKKIIMNYFFPVLNYLGVYDFFTSVSLSPELCKWLDEYNPDVVYAQASSRSGVLFCTMIQAYLKKPFVFHMMDDWPAMVREQGVLGGYWSKKVNKEIQKLFDKADLLLSISPYMASEYKKRYGKDFFTFHNPIDLQFWKKYRRTDFELGDNPSILYAGRLGTGIDSSLETIAQAVKMVNKELNIALSFVLQTAEKPAWANKYACVKHNHFVPYKELPQVFSASDFLILPYDFSVKSIKFIGFSMPTKAPEYMASGSPVIVFAPEETALVQYAQKYNCAAVVTTNEIKVLKDAIKDLVLNKDKREIISKRAIETVDKYHNAIEVKLSFRNLINTLQSS